MDVSEGTVLACIFAQPFLQVVWDKKLSDISKLQTGLKSLMPRKEVYTVLEAYFPWYKSNSVCLRQGNTSAN